MKRPTAAIDPFDPQYSYRPLWVVYGVSVSWPQILCCRINDRSGAATIWGYSVWKRQPGFRTLGIALAEWVARHGFCHFFVDQQQALDYLKTITAPKAGV